MKNKYFHLEHFSIDGENLDFPVVILNQEKKKTILITAGVDGDEYAGIVAAKRLVEILEKIKCEYRLIIIPVVNVFGNKEGVSFNPRDGKFPKYIYPGKINGTSSEKLLFCLDKYISQSFLWIDLHSGSNDEMLKPFIWTWKSKNKNVNERLISFVSTLKNEQLIYQKKSIRKIDELAKKDIAYIMLESGELGREDEEYITKHIEWVKEIITRKPVDEKIKIYQNVEFYRANKNGLWQPNVIPETIDEEKIVGTLENKKIKSRKGLIIYIKKQMVLKKGEEIFATAYEEHFI